MPLNLIFLENFVQKQYNPRETSQTYLAELYIDQLLSQNCKNNEISTKLQTLLKEKSNYNCAQLLKKVENTNLFKEKVMIHICGK